MIASRAAHRMSPKEQFQQSQVQNIVLGTTKMDDF